MIKIYLQNIFLPISIVCITIASIKMHALIPIDKTAIWWMIQSFVLIVLLLSKRHFFNEENEQSMSLVLIYLLWNLFNVLRGIFIAEHYWDWKNLIENFFRLMIPLAAFITTNKIITQNIYRSYIKYSLPLFIVFSLLITKDAYGFYLVPISYILLFFPILTNKWKLVMGVIAIIVLFADFGARSNVIKFGIPILLCPIYYFRSYLSNKVFEILRVLLFFIPLILFYLAVMDIFNVFNMDNYIKKDYVEEKVDSSGELIEDNLKSDTRTFLYVEVLNTARKYNTWWIGRSPARGNETEWFLDDDLTGRGERNTNEVGILNIFTWTGIIGVLLYFLVFYRASYLAINQSNNIFSKILGLFIAFRWLYAWVEDYNYFTLNTFFLFFSIGICFSTFFRQMSNEEVKYWIWGIFDKNYTLAYKTKIVRKHRIKPVINIE